MAWIYLLIAGLFEVVWAVGTKYCDTLRFSWPIVIVFIAMNLSVVFLALATKTIPMSTAYALWTGIGIIGVFIYSILVFKEPLVPLNLLFVGMILVGIIGLKLGMK